MSNGKSNVPHTWHEFIDILEADPIVRETLREAAKAKEIGPRAPAVLYLRAMQDAGNAYFEVLPEPWSDQDKKKHGDGTDVDADTVTVWNGNAKRYWDNYKYEVQGQMVSGSVYLDMVNRTEDGKAYLEFARLCTEWSKDGDKTGLPPLGTFNGVQYDLENMAVLRRADLKQMADGRRYTARDNLRTLVQIWRNVKDIEKLFKGIAEIDFVYEQQPDEKGNLILERVKKPIEVWAIQTLKEHPKFGQRSGNYFSCTSPQFANLAPRKVDAMPKEAKTFENLKRTKRKVAKAGAQPSTAEGGTTLDVRVTSNNVGPVIEKLAAYAEDEGSAAAFLNMLVHMVDTEERDSYITAFVEFYDFCTPLITSDWRQVHRRRTETRAEKRADELANKLRASEELKEVESQPTQNERNAADKWRDDEKARQDAAMQGTVVTTSQTGELPAHKANVSSKKKIRAK